MRIVLRYRPMPTGWWIALAPFGVLFWAALFLLGWQAALIVLGASQVAALALVWGLEASHG